MVFPAPPNPRNDLYSVVAPCFFCGCLSRSEDVTSTDSGHSDSYLTPRCSPTTEDSSVLGKRHGGLQMSSSMVYFGPTRQRGPISRPGQTYSVHTCISLLHAPHPGRWLVVLAPNLPTMHHRNSGADSVNGLRQL